MSITTWIIYLVAGASLRRRVVALGFGPETADAIVNTAMRGRRFIGDAREVADFVIRHQPMVRVPRIVYSNEAAPRFDGDIRPICRAIVQSA